MKSEKWKMEGKSEKWKPCLRRNWYPMTIFHFSLFIFHFSVCYWKWKPKWKILKNENTKWKVIIDFRNEFYLFFILCLKTRNFPVSAPRHTGVMLRAPSLWLRPPYLLVKPRAILEGQPLWACSSFEKAPDEHNLQLLRPTPRPCLNLPVVWQ